MDNAFVLYCGLILAILVAVHEAQPISRIVGGAEATKNQFPHQISLRYNGLHNCGGSIISRNYVLTAAHCVGGFNEEGVFKYHNTSLLSIRAGSIDRFQGGVLVNVVEAVAHEKYGDFLNDVALLRVETPFIFSANLQPIRLASINTPPNVDIIVSGWGRVKTNGDIPRILKWNTITSLSLEDCEKHIGWGIESALCLLHTADNGVCNGDSGGPALYNDEVVGIAGFVVGGCGTTNPDGYARVYYYRDWIKQHSDL